MREYNPNIIGFIVSVEKNRLWSVKEQIIGAVTKLESDDKAYIYPNLQVPRWPGPAVGQIANFSGSNFLIGEAMKKTILLFAEEDEDANRFIFVIVDSFDSSMTYKVKKALAIDSQISLFESCVFHFCGVGDKYDRKLLESMCKLHPKCTYHHFDDIESIGKFINERTANTKEGDV